MSEKDLQTIKKNSRFINLTYIEVTIIFLIWTMRTRLTLRLYLVLALVFSSFYKEVKACSPLNTPYIATQTIVGTSFIISVGNTSAWLNCPNVIDVEFACFSSNFSGAVANTYTSSPQTFVSSPYTYGTQTISIANLCPGTIYKFRMRERNNGSSTSSGWSPSFTFATAGVSVTPVLNLSAFPNLICPPAPVQLQASLSNTCGTSPVIYAWFPTTGLNNPSIANPIANISSPTSYTCVATGGATGCWGAVSVIFINVGTGPPVPGIASVSPSVLCVYNSATLSTTAYTGNIQWQASTSSFGPWNNIPGATTATYVVPSVSATTCFQAVLTSCSGATLASNVTCALTNTVPTLFPSNGCTNSLSTLSFSYVGASGTPTNIVWSPPPVSVSNNSTTAFFTNSGTYYALAFYGDGCIASTSFSLVVPTVLVNTSTVSCAALGSATVQATNITGPVAYSWLPSPQTTSVATGLFPGSYTNVVSYNNNLCYYTNTINLISNSPLTTTVVSSPSVQCPGAQTGTASILVAGGSANTSYTWTNANLAINTPSAAGLIAGIHSITVQDQVTFCQQTTTFQIAAVPAHTLTIAASSATSCIGSTATLTASNSGGTPGYTYQWVNGASNSMNLVTESNSGPSTYTVVSSDANNCQSTQTVSITYLNLPNVSIVNTSICPGKTGTLTASGANTYTWNNNASYTGSTFTANPNVTTFYNVSGTANGCTGNAAGQIQMLSTPVPIITSNNPVCTGLPLNFSASGGTSYKWTGPLGFNSTNQINSLSSPVSNQSGIYNVTVTAANTCTALSSATFTIYPPPPVTAIGSTVCSTSSVNLFANSSALQYSWTGPGFSSAQQNPIFGNLSSALSGNYTVKVTSAEGCTNTTVAQVTITQMPVAVISSNGPLCTGADVILNGTGGNSYLWTGPNAFNSAVQTPTLWQIPFSGGGIYNLQATTGPCIANTSYSLTVWPLPVVLASSSGNICETKTVQLFCQTAGTVVSYSWQGPFFSSVKQNPTRTPASLLQNGAYTVTVTDANNCIQSATTAVTVLQNPNVSANGATVCLNQPAILTANGANTYQWSGPDLFQSVQNTPTISMVTPLQIGAYTLIGKAVNGCTSAAVVTVATMPLPITSLSVYPSTTICLGTNIRLEGGGAVYYKWYGPEDLYAEGQVANFTANNLKFQGTYTVVAIDDNGCKSGKTVFLQVFPLPEGTLSGLSEGCVPFCQEYRFLPNSNPHMSAVWELNKTIYPQKFYKCLDEPGSYKITASLYDSITTCRNTRSFTISALPAPESKFELVPSRPIENLDEAIFTSKSEGDNLTQTTWHFASLLPLGPTEVYKGQTVNHIFSDAGKYAVAMVTSNKWGCEDTLVKMVEVQSDFAIYVPEVFTPNGDQVNEKFMAITRGVSLFEMSIYNRWGARVFYCKDAREGWDGRLDDTDCMSDTYTWRITATSLRGEQKQLSGPVTLYR